MPDISRPKSATASQDEPLHGFVVTPPASLTDSFTVRAPGFSNLHVFEIDRWMPRGGDKPAKGDRVLIVFDDAGEPWVPAWWPE